MTNSSEFLIFDRRGAEGFFAGGLGLRGGGGLGRSLSGSGRRRGCGCGHGFEGDAGLGGEFGEGLVGEGFLFGFFHGDVGHVHAVAGDAGAAGGFFLFLLHDALEAVECVAAAAELRDHPAGHLGEFGGGFLDFHVVDREFQRLDLLLRGFDRVFAGAEEFLIGGFGGFGLGAIFVEFLAKILETEGVLRGGFLVGGFQVRHGFGAEVALFQFLALDLRHEALAKSGVAGQALVVLGDLFAEVFLFHFEERFGILALDAGNEEAQETTNQIGHSLNHNDSVQFIY